MGLRDCASRLRCCGKGEPVEKKKSDPLAYKRFCTDILMCIFFAVFCVVLLLIFIFAMNTGDYYGLLYDADYLGDRCGVGKHSNAKKAFYPRIPRDMAAQSDKVNSGQFWKVELYALCVDECPKGFDLNNPKVITDYGYDLDSSTTQALGDGTQADWIAATPTVDMLNRCIPRTEASTDVTKMCAYPECLDADVVAAGGVCTTNPGFGVNKSWAMTTDAHMDLCIVQAKQSSTMVYQMAASDDASQAMLSSVADAVGGIFEVASALIDSMDIIIGLGIGAPVALAFIYMIFLYKFAHVVIWTLLLLLVVVELVATFICFAKSGMAFDGVSADSLMESGKSAGNVTVPDAATEALASVNDGSTWAYTAGFWVLLLATLITILTIILSRRKIKICAAIVKEATTVFKDMPFMMLFPTWGVVAQCGLVVWFVLGLMLLYTVKAEAFDSYLGALPNATFAPGGVAAAPTVDPIGGLRDMHGDENLMMLMVVIHIYGFFTLVQWVQCMSFLSMSGATGWWYYFAHDNDDSTPHYRFPLVNSVAVQFTFHMGSAAFAAFILALFDLVRTIVAYVEYQMKDKVGNNVMVWLAFKVITCCINCLKKTVEIITMYGLVFVSVNGNSFCWACKRTFGFFVSNAGQVAINSLVVFVIRMLAIGTAPLGCAILGFWICDANGLTNPMYPAIFIFIAALVMTISCMSVFECVITTVFVCSFEDKAEYDGKYMVAHPGLAKVLNVDLKKHKDKGSPAKAEAKAEEKETLQQI
jgi:hypothetical protein